MTKQPRHRKRAWRRGWIVVQVYLRHDELGDGPAISVRRRDVEILRYDLFPGAAHFHHRADRRHPRRYFPPGLTLAAYVDLALVDLHQQAPEVTPAADWIRAQVAAIAGAGSLASGPR